MTEKPNVIYGHKSLYVNRTIQADLPDWIKNMWNDVGAPNLVDNKWPMAWYQEYNKAWTLAHLKRRKERADVG